MIATTVTKIILLALIHSVMSADISPNPKTFFPSIDGNLTKILWAHGINSRAKLTKALTSDEVMMLEADVVMGKLYNSTENKTIPVMAHPPDTESDLSLEDFVSLVVHNGTKGMKLDFKSIEAFNNSKGILTTWRSKCTIPVFINADILSGPINSTAKPVDAATFIKGVMEIFPESTLSVGWTTRYDNVTVGHYSTEHTEGMIRTLSERNVSQAVTYPVRAAIAVNDIDLMESLIKNSSSVFHNVTLTVWSSYGDYVEPDKISKLVKTIGVDKVYVDVPESVRSKLNLASSASTFELGATMMITLGAVLASINVWRML